MSDREVKQVIVIRRDLKMRRGKEIAQGSHASMAFLTRRLQMSSFKSPSLTDPERQWMSGIFTKVVVKVTSLEELVDIFGRAQDAGLESHMITDVGKTEFDGIPTQTAVAIGPDYADKIDLITAGLSLY